MAKSTIRGFGPFSGEESLLNGLLSSESTDRVRAEKALFDSCVHYIHKARQKYSFSEEEALSAYADAVLSLIKHVRAGTFRGESKLSTYLFQIFQHKCVDLFRKHTSQKNKADWVYELPHVSDPIRDALGKLIEEEQVSKLMRLLHTLGEKCKRLLLYWGEGYSMEEIADLLQFRDAGSAKSRKYKCLQGLKKRYQESAP